MPGPDPKWLLREALDEMVTGNDLGSMDEALPALTAFVAEFAAPDFVCTQPSAMVFAFDGDRVSRVEFHLDRDAALLSAGLDPEPR